MNKDVAPFSPPLPKGRTLLSPDDQSNDVTNDSNKTDVTLVKEPTEKTTEKTADNASKNNNEISASKLEKVLRDLKASGPSQDPSISEDKTPSLIANEVTPPIKNNEEISAIKLEQALKDLKLSQSSVGETGNDVGQTVKPLPDSPVQPPVNILQSTANYSQVSTNNLPVLGQSMILNVQQLATLNLPLPSTTQPILPVLLPEPERPLQLSNQAETPNSQVLAAANEEKLPDHPVNWYVGYGPSPLSKGAEAASVTGKIQNTP